MHVVIQEKTSTGDVWFLSGEHSMVSGECQQILQIQILTLC